jgi:thiosulfate dehydrogenase [quinone] large subunit
VGKSKDFVTQIPEPGLSKFLFSDTRFAIVWLIVRLYVGWQWLQAGWEKVNDPVWTGAQAGSAVQGFLTGALTKASGAHPSVQSWYAAFIKSFALHHTVGFSYTVAWGELLVGIALILGIFTGLAAFFGVFMNMNYLLAGTVSINPVLLILEIPLMLGWRIAGWFGLDRFVLKRLATPLRKKS